MSAMVLVAEHEPYLRHLVEATLRFHGFTVTTAVTGAVVRRRTRDDRPDLILLDVMLPGEGGFEVCRRLRADGDQTPIIFLGARDNPSDTVAGLALGGDDYVTKPFSLDAVVARIRAVLRRVRSSGEGDEEILTVADVVLDEARWTVRRAGIGLELSPTEFRLLAYLMRNQGRMLTRAQLLAGVWGWERARSDRVVETYIGYLRRKLDPLGPPLIHTQRGVGYVLRPPS